MSRNIDYILKIDPIGQRISHEIVDLQEGICTNFYLPDANHGHVEPQLQLICFTCMIFQEFGLNTFKNPKFPNKNWTLFIWLLRWLRWLPTSPPNQRPNPIPNFACAPADEHWIRCKFGTTKPTQNTILSTLQGTNQQEPPPFSQVSAGKSGICNFP